MTPIRITCFTDVLCVWAYIAQIRLDELKSTFGAEVAIDHRFVSVFGNPVEKLEARWKDKGGLHGYSAHVREMAKPYGHVAVHPDIWTTRTPRSSLSGHLFLCAVRSARNAGQIHAPGSGDPFDTLIWSFRSAFFTECADISSRSVQLAMAERLGIDPGPVLLAIESGEAYAELAKDMELSREQGVTMSPTLIFNEGRQRLNGNVGYRVIEANVRELLRNPEGEHSWC